MLQFLGHELLLRLKYLNDIEYSVSEIVIYLGCMRHGNHRAVKQQLLKPDISRNPGN